jgi:hydrogenase-4 membrane subunit HyfE
MNLHQFCMWLSETPASGVVQNTPWVIPAVQSVHIAGIALVISSVFLVDLRVLKVLGRENPIAVYASRFLPLIWFVLPVLLLTGIILIIGEPSRALENPAFQLKMAMLILAMGVTLVMHRPLLKEATYWDAESGHSTTARVLAVLSLFLWVSIIFAGRWIAYVNVGE